MDLLKWIFYKWPFVFTACLTVYYFMSKWCILMGNSKIMFFFLIGSLAKGTSENVISLVEQGTATALVELLKTVPVDTKLAEAGLCALRSVFLHPPAPISALPADMRLLTRLTRKLIFFIFSFINSQSS